MGEPQGPCKGCGKRTAEDPESGTRDCHISCEEYAEYRKRLAEYKIKISRARAWNAIMNRPWMGQHSKAQEEYRAEKKEERKRRRDHDREE